MLLERLPNWRKELGKYQDDIRSTYWFGIMSKAVALCEVVVSGRGQYVLRSPHEKNLTMGQWANIVKQASHPLPGGAEAQEILLALLSQLVTLRNDFVHRAFTVSGTRFALSFLDCCEQFVHSEVVVQIAKHPATPPDLEANVAGSGRD